MKFCVANMIICHWFTHTLIPRYFMLLIIESNVWDQGEGGLQMEGVMVFDCVGEQQPLYWSDGVIKNKSLIN